MQISDKVRIVKEIETTGYFVLQNVVEDSVIQVLKQELACAIRAEVAFHGTTEYRDYGIVNALPMYGDDFLRLLDNPALLAPYEMMLDEGCIVHVYMSSSLPPMGKNYASRIHVDRPRFIPCFREAFDGLVLISDFNEENGATWILPGSHKMKERPTEEHFYANAVRLTAKAGSVFYFDPQLWHAAGINRTDEWRYALAVGMVRPYIKQKFDLPRILENRDLSFLSDRAIQKLGFHSRPPISLEEYYAPLEKRSYRQRSEWEMRASDRS